MRVAFVVQRSGREVVGGAESLCLQVAERMIRHWQVEILTTCALDYMTWHNSYPEGAECVGEVTIRRFPVDHPRDVACFDQLSVALLARGEAASIEEQEAWMRAQGPMSSRLFDYLQQTYDAWDAFIFFGYLYATTYFGLPLVWDKALLAPLGHDEWPIYLSMWDRFFRLPTGFIFQAPEEQEFLQRRFPSLPLIGEIAGIGIDAPPEPEPERFKEKYDLTAPFLLYVGRIDAAKGCGEMFEYFMRLRANETRARKLVLIGKEILPIPFHDDIIYVGFVEESLKWSAMAACDWLLMPSSYESLSIVLLETWMVARPALVSATSQVLVGHCRRSNGGLWYSDYAEWFDVLTTIDDTSKSALGRHGMKYVAREYSWERIEKSYRTAVERTGPRPAARSDVSVSAP